MNKSVVGFAHVVDYVYPGWVSRNILAGTFTTESCFIVSKYRRVTPYVIVTELSGTNSDLEVFVEGRRGRIIQGSQMMTRGN